MGGKSPWRDWSRVWRLSYLQVKKKTRTVCVDVALETVISLRGWEPMAAGHPDGLIQLWDLGALGSHWLAGSTGAGWDTHVALPITHPGCPPSGLPGGCWRHREVGRWVEPQDGGTRLWLCWRESRPRVALAVHPGRGPDVPNGAIMKLALEIWSFPETPSTKLS